MEPAKISDPQKNESEKKEERALHSSAARCRNVV
jgi:hypothetical protein